MQNEATSSVAVFLREKRRILDCDTEREERHVVTEAETGKMRLQGKGLQNLPAATRNQKEARRDSYLETLGCMWLC